MLYLLFLKEGGVLSVEALSAFLQPLNCLFTF